MVDLTDATDDDNEREILHILKVEVEDIPMKEVNKETAQADAQAPPIEYGCGMRTRKKPISYAPVMTGKSYRIQQGVNNLCYRGNRYRLPCATGLLQLNTKPNAGCHTFGQNTALYHKLIPV